MTARETMASATFLIAFMAAVCSLTGFTGTMHSLSRPGTA